MEDGITYFHCCRPNCWKLVGAQRFEEGVKVEEEWVPEVVHEGNNYYCSKECFEKKEVWLALEELMG